MNLSTAVQSIVSKYGYEVFNNLHLIKDEELSEAVKTVRLARRSDDEIDQELHELVKTCRSIDEISQKISLSKRTTLKHLNFHVWGRAFIEKVFPKKQIKPHELYHMTQAERMPLLELSLETKCSMPNLKRQLTKYDWGRSYLASHCETFAGKKRRRNGKANMANN